MGIQVYLVEAAGRECSHPVLPPLGFGEPEGRAVCVWSGPLKPSRKMGGGGRSGREVQGWGKFTSGGSCMDFTRRVPAKKIRRWPVGNGGERPLHFPPRGSGGGTSASEAAGS